MIDSYCEPSGLNNYRGVSLFGSLQKYIPRCPHLGVLLYNNYGGVSLFGSLQKYIPRCPHLGVLLYNNYRGVSLFGSLQKYIPRCPHLGVLLYVYNYIIYLKVSSCHDGIAQIAGSKRCTFQTS